MQSYPHGTQSRTAAELGHSGTRLNKVSRRGAPAGRPRWFDSRSSTRRARTLIAMLLLTGFPQASNAGETSVCVDFENFLVDGEFQTIRPDRPSGVWRVRQHATAGSFEMLADKGVLSVRKIGPEPWTLINQSVSQPGLGGATIVYSADLKLDLTDPDPPHGFEYGGGLHVEAVNANRRTIFRSVMEHEPRFGSSDWRRVRVTLRLPESTRQLRVGVIHQAGGTLMIRNPMLYFEEFSVCEDMAAEEGLQDGSD